MLAPCDRAPTFNYARPERIIRSNRGFVLTYSFTQNFATECCSRNGYGWGRKNESMQSSTARVRGPHCTDLCTLRLLGNDKVKRDPAVCWFFMRTAHPLGHFNFALVLLKWRSYSALSLFALRMSRQFTRRPQSAPTPPDLHDIYFFDKNF